MADVTVSTDLWIESGSPLVVLSTDQWSFTYSSASVTFSTDLWSFTYITLASVTFSTDLWDILFGIHTMYNAGTNGKHTIAPPAGTTNTPILDGSGVTAVRTYTLPDASGTVMLDSGTGHFIDAETPTGTINSVNVTFTLAHTPAPTASLQLILNGIYQTAGGTDYTLSAGTITFVTAPTTGDILRAFYRY